MDFLACTATFLRVAEAGSLSSAARSLRVSLSVVSRHLAWLERELGAPLLARTTRRLELTDAGRRFRERAAVLLREASEARASVRGPRALAGRLTLSASVSLGALRVVPSLPAFLDAHPRLDLELRLEDRAADLVGEGVDVALRGGFAPPDSASVIAQPVATFRQLLVASPAYLRARGTPRSLDDLARHVAVRGPSAPAPWHFEVGGEARAVSVPTRLRVGTLLGLAEAAVAGLGLAALPEFVVQRALAARALRALDVGAALPTVTVRALYRTESRGDARVEALVAHLRRTVPTAARGPGAPAGARGPAAKAATPARRPRPPRA
ncbi:MAG TPA: LysR substrate-binding domain-containing protein [Polyangiaceae bacterium]|nr:LysR substrate-binding domain-containing protein [Polyangiaceae bacterium]